MKFIFDSKVWFGNADQNKIGEGNAHVTVTKSPYSKTNDSNLLFFQLSSISDYSLECYDVTFSEGSINDAMYVIFGNGVNQLQSKFKVTKDMRLANKYNIVSDKDHTSWVFQQDVINGGQGEDEPSGGIVFYYNTQSGEPLGLENESPANKRFFTPEGTEITNMYKATLDSFDEMGGKTVEWLIFEDGVTTAPSVLGEIYAKFVVFPDSVVNWSDNSLSYVLGTTGYIRMNINRYTNWFEHNSGLKNGCNIIVCNNWETNMNMWRDTKIFDSEVLTGEEVNVFCSEVLNGNIFEGCNIYHTFADAPFSSQSPIMYQSDEIRNLSTSPYKVDIDGQTYTLNTYIQHTDTDSGFKMIECVGFNVGETVIELQDQMSESLVVMDCQKIRNLGGNHTIALTYSDIVNLYETYRDSTIWYVQDELVPVYTERYGEGATYLPISTLG